MAICGKRNRRKRLFHFRFPKIIRNSIKKEDTQNEDTISGFDSVSSQRASRF